MTRMVPFLLVAALGSGCATMSVGSYANRYANFTGYSTYDWGTPDALPTGDPRLDNNGMFEDYFEGAVEKGMAAKGFQRPFDGPPDLVLHYHTSVIQRIDVASVERMYQQCNNNPDCRAEATDYDEVTIMLDAVDTSTEKLIWRGWARTNLNGIADDQERLERMVDKAVAKMLQGFPPVHPRAMAPPVAMLRPTVSGLLVHAN